MLTTLFERRAFMRALSPAPGELCLSPLGFLTYIANDQLDLWLVRNTHVIGRRTLSIVVDEAQVDGPQLSARLEIHCDLNLSDGPRVCRPHVSSSSKILRLHLLNLSLNP